MCACSLTTDLEYGVSSGSVDQDHRHDNESGKEDEEEAHMAIMKSWKSSTCTIQFSSV